MLLVDEKIDIIRQSKVLDECHSLNLVHIALNNFFNYGVFVLSIMVCKFYILRKETRCFIWRRRIVTSWWLSYSWSAWSAGSTRNKWLALSTARTSCASASATYVISKSRCVRSNFMQMRLLEISKSGGANTSRTDSVHEGYQSRSCRQTRSGDLSQWRPTI